MGMTQQGNMQGELPSVTTSGQCCHERDTAGETATLAASDVPSTVMMMFMLPCHGIMSASLPRCKQQKVSPQQSLMNTSDLPLSPWQCPF